MNLQNFHISAKSPQNGSISVGNLFLEFAADDDAP
jgi:hypothetical protein